MSIGVAVGCNLGGQLTTTLVDLSQPLSQITVPQKANFEIVTLNLSLRENFTHREFPGGVQ